MMFREKSISKLYAYALAAVFALTLAGCGGGGSGAAATDPVDPAPMPDTRLSDAQEAAAAAAMLANTALNAAKEAVSGVSDIQDYDNLHYDLAGGALNDARRAKQAADAANTAAMAAGTAEDAEAAQAAAEAAQADAEDALALANTFVGAVQAAKTAADDAMDDMQLTTDLMKAVVDATTARDAAVVASGQATMRLQELVDSDVGTNVEVSQATLDKAAADLEVMAANTALADALDAQTARDLAAAQAAVTAAQMAQENAEEKRDAIGAVKMGYDDEQQRMDDVATARSNANTSAMEADADATKADAAAERVEAIAPDSAAATNARAAATAAREAADAAQMALGAITDGMSKVDADAQAEIAANQAMYANNGYMMASGIKDTTETSLGITQEENRMRDVADATTAANDAAMAAKSAANEADDAADAAESARDKAQAAYMKAVAARTDSVNAKTHYEAANTAATAARTAADDAMQAYMDAKSAADGIDADGSTEDAKTAQGKAETEQGNAEDERDTAEMKQGDAETAEMAAVDAAGTHVIGLFKMANADHIMTAADPDANTDETEAELIAKNKADHVENVIMAIAATAIDQGDGTAEAMWEYGVEGAGRLSITVSTTVDGAGLSFDDVNDDADKEDDMDERTAFRLSRDLGDFMHGFEISGDGGTRAIVFTDKEQANAPVPASTVNLTNDPVTDHSRVTPTAAPSTTDDAIHDFAGSYDHDGDPDTTELTGTFDCVDPTTCRLTRTGTGADGGHTDATKVTSISGYRFTGTGTTPAKLSVEDMDYLAFGVWLTEAVVDTATNTYTFGAFHDGGDPVESGDNIAMVTGEASYEGSATGVRALKGSVDYFEGDATLTAKFGDEEALGSLTGEINKIVAGGMDVGYDIFLDLSDQDVTANINNITQAGSASGRTRMGTGTLGPDGEQDYPLNGLWSAQFYNPQPDDDDGENSVAPNSVAGTFGVTNADMDASYVGAFGAYKK